MKLIIECDGALLDVQPIYWSAYSKAVGEIGLARTDEETFWSAVRAEAPTGKVLRGAKLGQIHDYEARFNELIDSDDAAAGCRARVGVGGVLERLNKHGACVMITASANRESRQKALDVGGLSVHFTQMCKLFSQESRRADQLRELTGGDRRVVVAASTIPVVRAASSAELLVVGVSNGPCTARRLTQAGAQWTCSDLEDLADELESGAQNLRGCGLLPAALDEQAPVFETPDRHGRSSRGRGRGGYRSR